MRSLGLGIPLDDSFLRYLSFTSSWEKDGIARIYGIFFSLPQMAGRGRGRGRGAGDVGAEMNDLQEDGNVALNQAVLGMNADMQAIQNMMQQQEQMFQQLMAQNMAQ